MMAEIERRFSNLIKRALGSAASDKGLVQTVKIDVHVNDGSHDVERWQQLGLASMPVDGDAALVLSVAGHRFVVALDDLKNRPKDLDNGEVVLWHRNGDEVRLKNGNTIHAKTKDFIVDARDSFTVNSKAVAINATESYALSTTLATLNVSTRMTVTSPMVVMDVVSSHFTGTVKTVGLLTMSGGFAAAPVVGGGTNAVSGDLLINGRSFMAHNHDDPVSGNTGGVN